MATPTFTQSKSNLFPRFLILAPSFDLESLLVAVLKGAIKHRSWTIRSPNFRAEEKTKQSSLVRQGSSRGMAWAGIPITI